MTIDELKEAFRAGTPVAFGDITYKCVSALIYRRGGKGFVIQAELQDRNNNSVTIAEPSRITTPGKGDGK